MFGGLASLLLIVAAALAAFSVRPRQNDIEEGLVAWTGILKKNNADTYIESVKEADHAKEIMRHCYNLSTILRKKYALMRWAIDFFMAGSAMAIILFIITTIE